MIAAGLPPSLTSNYLFPVTFYDVLRYTRLPPFSIGINMGFATYVSCCKNFHRALLGISLLHAFMGRTSHSNYLGSMF